MRQNRLNFASNIHDSTLENLPKTSSNRPKEGLKNGPQKFLKSKVNKNSRKVISQNFKFIYTYDFVTISEENTYVLFQGKNCLLAKICSAGTASQEMFCMALGPLSVHCQLVYLWLYLLFRAAVFCSCDL